MTAIFDGFKLFEKKADSPFEEIIAEQAPDKPDDVSIFSQKLDRLIKSVENIQKQLDSLKSADGFNFPKKPNIAKSEEKTTLTTLDGNIKKYSKIAKTTAHVIEILADGLIVIVDSVKESANVNMDSGVESRAQIMSNKKLDLSGVLKSVENLIGNLATSLDTVGKQPVKNSQSEQ